MKSFGKITAVFLIFMAGTLLFAHIDRQSAANAGSAPWAMEKIENFIEK